MALGRRERVDSKAERRERRQLPLGREMPSDRLQSRSEQSQYSGSERSPGYTGREKRVPLAWRIISSASIPIDSNRLTSCGNDHRQDQETQRYYRLTGSNEPNRSR